ncbi:MAG: transaldolase family protein [Clostridiaceae bacterium]|nr:transaldolase family protein [Clostridiaceae bacterium]
MLTVNLPLKERTEINLKYTLKSLLNKDITVARGEESYCSRILNHTIRSEDYFNLKRVVKNIGVTERFKDVIDTFNVPEKITPAGFRIEYDLEDDGLLRADLIRDISYDENGIKRPTKVLFSADTANPYELEPISGMLANLTCNPGIIYDLFINNPKANTNNLFKTREEVMTEIGRILGPGCDISVELNNPFNESFEELLEEAEKFKEILSPYRVVIKVPHTGPVNAQNVSELLKGDKKLGVRYNAGSTKDALRGHNLALRFREEGYRINFTLMFEPYQAALALQAKPYFINSFIRHRLGQTETIKRQLDLYKFTEDPIFLADLRKLFIDNDYLSKNETDKDLFEIKKIGERIVDYRKINDKEGIDGLDSARHNLRMLKNVNLPDTRLIICSMEGEYNYPAIDKLLIDPEFKDVLDRLVITAEPNYLAAFTSTNQVVSYQRRFMNAVNNK